MSETAAWPSGMQGYCANGACKVFPVAIANFGSALRTAEDLAFSTDLASYFTLNGSANDQSHARIPGFIWDGWNNAALGGDLCLMLHLYALCCCCFHGQTTAIPWSCLADVEACRSTYGSL